MSEVHSTPSAKPAKLYPEFPLTAHPAGYWCKKIPGKITHRGLSWAKDTNDCPVAKETAKLLHRLSINGRKGPGFYTLRHTFRTLADESKDQPAGDSIMGHEVSHLSSVYRETISDARLQVVTDHVRAWLFGTVHERSGNAGSHDPATARPVLGGADIPPACGRISGPTMGPSIGTSQYRR